MRTATIERLAKTIYQQTDAELAREQALELRERFKAALLRSKVLDDFACTLASEPLIAEDRQAFFEFTFTHAFSARFTAELVFSLKGGQVVSASRITSQLLNREPHSECESEVKFYNIEGLAKLAVQRAVEQRIGLMQELGFNVTAPTVKKLVKTVGHLAL